VSDDAHDGRKARVIALYLPQYHPIAENDEWWGPGFTEWTNVARARPLYPGHDQPRLPGALGFYDLRLPETRAAQAELARAHGIAAFCYWHYWFAGRRLLELPFQQVLERGEPDFPFCLGWANQDWSTVWTGGNRVLVAQTYPGPDDHARHFDALLPAFHDPRYLRVDGRPLFFVYRPHHLPEPQAFVEQWRGLAEAAGLPGLYLVGETKGGWSAATAGFDADLTVPLYDLARPRLTGPVGARIERLRRRPRRVPYTSIPGPVPASLPHPSLPVVMSNWDNTPRFGRRGFVLTGATPEAFGRVLRGAVDAVGDLPSEQRLVFLKSWNEWAEGNYVEPDRVHGDAYLRQVAAAVGVETTTCPPAAAR
jgi:lipopolysaccharide biosynthesis protein